jgi:uncharacterized protein (TIGR03067 family)
MRGPLLYCCLLLLTGTLRAQDSTAAETARLQGEWRLVSVLTNGQTVTNPPVGIRRTIGDTVTVTLDGQLLLHAIMTLDPGMTPKFIDYEVIGGQMQGVQLSGIYRLDGSRLTICLGGPGGARPDEFVAPAGVPGSCTVWEKR